MARNWLSNLIGRFELGVGITNKAVSFGRHKDRDKTLFSCYFSISRPVSLLFTFLYDSTDFSTELLSHSIALFIFVIKNLEPVSCPFLNHAATTTQACVWCEGATSH